MPYLQLQCIMAAGLQSHIWNNNLKSTVLLMLYPVLILALTWGCAYAVAFLTHNDPGASGVFAKNIIITYAPAIVTGVIIWFTVAYFFHTHMIQKLSHAHPVTRREEPDLYNLLENLCIAGGMPMPTLNIIETHARNAFASGINQKTFAVTVTRGLMNSLAKDELEGVLAHELAHIQNRDVRLLIISVIFTGMIGFAAQLVWSNLRVGYIYSGQRRGKGNGILIMLAIAAILWVGYMATLCTRFAISRRREYMADAGAVMMTKNPDAMMRALMRISGKDTIPETSDDIMMMCIENRKAFMGLFRTHPPIDSRIEALSEMTNTPVPDAMSLPPVAHAQRFNQSKEKPRNPWLIRSRRS